MKCHDCKKPAGLRPEIAALLHERRFTRFLNLTEDVPWVRGECAWCAGPGRKGFKYCSDDCANEANIRASGVVVSTEVFRRDKGICTNCGLDCDWLRKEYREIQREYKYDFRDQGINLHKQWGPWHTSTYVFWAAHHIIPVYMGGGVCGLENYETLCVRCHKEKHSHYGARE